MLGVWIVSERSSNFQLFTTLYTFNRINMKPTLPMMQRQAQQQQQTPHQSIPPGQASRGNDAGNTQRQQQPPPAASEASCREIEELRPRYESALEAVRHQQLVIAKLEHLLTHKMELKPLVVDTAVLTDPLLPASESLFMTTLRLRLDIDRIRQQRANEKAKQEDEVRSMERDLDELKAQVLASMPGGMIDAANGRTDGLLNAAAGMLRVAPRDPSVR